MPRSTRRAFAAVVAALLIAACLGPRAAAAAEPTQANVPYGKHQRQVLDFYRARAERPTPLLFFVHGGGWMSGDKARPDFLDQCLGAGISLVSINYRLIPDAATEKIWPPVKACLDDTARALQFVRSQARPWNIDTQRIGGCGGSAGGFNVLWLAFHADLADARSADPVARQSTRLCCALTFVPQTSLDPRQMKQWIPNINYGHHGFGLVNYQEFLDKRAALLPWIEEFSPYALAARGAPPVCLFYDSVPRWARRTKTRRTRPTSAWGWPKSSRPWVSSTRSTTRARWGPANTRTCSGFWWRSSKARRRDSDPLAGGQGAAAVQGHGQPRGGNPGLRGSHQIATDIRR